MLSLVIVALCLAAPAVHCADWDEWTPLDDYVNRTDPFYGFELMEIMQGDGYSVHVLNFTSQKWFDEEWTSNPIWWHHLMIIIPDVIRIPDAALYRISNDGYGFETPDIDDFWIQLYAGFSLRTGAVSAILKQDPNQPVTFPGDPLNFPRTEDFIIAHTWARYIESEEAEPDKEIILQMPMVKAGKNGMDAIVEYTHSVNPDINIDKYVPTGASKRGWVSWLLGCVDRRVMAMAPIVFDMLDFVNGLDVHNQAMGGWSWALFPYWSEPVTKYVRHPRTEEIGDVIDPFFYNERLTMPKLVSIAANDEFFLPTDTYLFWQQLNGAPYNYMLVLENQDHSHSDSHDRILASTEAMFLAVLNGDPMPVMSWERVETDTAGILTMTTDTTPTSMRGWVGDTTEDTGERRDFRLAIMGNIPGNIVDNPILFEETTVEDLGGNTYRMEQPIRETGWRGFWMDVCFPAGAGPQFCFTTEFHCIPDTLPFPPCETPQECQGVIV